MKILVVRRDNIGDLICTTPLIAALRQAYPSAYIAALVNSYNAPVLEGNADLDQVYVYSKYKHVRGEQPRLAWVYSRLKLLWQLRRQQFDWAILARTGFDIHGLRFAHQIKPKKILGFAPIDRTEPLLTVPVAEGPGEHEHEVELTFRLLDALGIHAAPGPLKLAVPSLAKQELADRAPELFTKKPLIAFHISAREESRQWPLNKWQALGRFVLEKTAYNILLLWAPGKSDDPLHPGDDELAESLSCDLASIGCLPFLRKRSVNWLWRWSRLI